MSEAPIWSSVLLKVVLLVPLILIYAILDSYYVIVIIIEDKELGGCRDGWAKCVEVRGPPSRKWDNARSLSSFVPRASVAGSCPPPAAGFPRAGKG